jgi:hypothetical protein
MPSQPIAANQERYCSTPTDSSPGWCPGVVLPRLMPGRKVASPLAVCSASRPFAAVASVSRPATRRGAGAHDGSSGGGAMPSSPATPMSGVTAGIGVAPASVRHMASVTTPMTAALTGPYRCRSGAWTR